MLSAIHVTVALIWAASYLVYLDSLHHINMLTYLFTYCSLYGLEMEYE